MSDSENRLSDAAMREIVTTLAYLAVMAAVSLAIAKRDTVTRLWMRARQLGRRPDPHAAQVAEFRRDIADISRGTSGPDTGRARGLWESP